MEESTCHEMVIYLSQRFSSMSCFYYVFVLFFVFCTFFISSKYDSYIDAEIIIVKTREM